MTVSIKYTPTLYKLNEDNVFDCTHDEAYVENPTDPTEAMYVCPSCDCTATAEVDGIDEWGHLEYEAKDWRND